MRRDSAAQQGTIWVLGIAGILAAGCGTDGRVPVKGTVTLDGRPLKGVTVVFHASPSTKGNGGYADTNASGRFQATTHQMRPGLYPGDYTITVELPKYPPVGQPVDPDPPRIPGRYGSPEKTPFALKIDGRQGPLALEMTSSAK